MSVDKFKFVSPGVFINEIDESGVTQLPERMGPVVIGRFAKGPGKRPVRVDSFKEFTALFGEPAPGTAKGDIWRTGDMTAPTYAAYAVQAWLRNNSPCTVYRVMGEQHPNATSAGKAGWTTDASLGTDLASAGGAYGLVVFPSASSTTPVTGTVAAIWYVQDGAIVLSGSAQRRIEDAAAVTVGNTGVLFEGDNLEFTAKLVSGAPASAGDGGKIDSTNVGKEFTFNFDKDSDKFIRKVFNTDPTKTNSDLVDTDTTTLHKYWLGETFESNLLEAQNSELASAGSTFSGTKYWGVILGLDSSVDSGDVDWHNHQQEAKAARTGWFISQDTRGNTTSGFDPTAHTETLFKFHALDSGEHANRDYKISIEDIRAPSDNFNSYGTFTVLVRRATDSDQNPIVLERFSGVSLDPTSVNYIKKVIGDRYFTFNTDTKVLRENGEYDNRSKFIRVEVTPIVADGGAEGLHPYGVYGPIVPETLAITNATNNTDSTVDRGDGTTETIAGAFWLVSSGSSGAVLPSGSIHAQHSANKILNLPVIGDYDGLTFTGSVKWPTTRLRHSSSEGSMVIASNAYWGYNASRKNTRIFDKTNIDLLRGQPAGLDPSTKAPTNRYSWVFTLDDIVESATDTQHAYHESGSRASGVSWTAKSGSAFILTGSGTGFDRFTSPMFGGFDGFDVTEKDPLRNKPWNDSPGSEAANYVHYSLKKSIDMLSDAEFVEFDIATMPGITTDSLNNSLVDMCTDRGDSLAIIDVRGGYQPSHESNATEANRLGSVAATVNALKDMNINSSYGCAFYPFVRIRDLLNDSILYVPPSVVALGTFSSSQSKSAVWFAPAGFTRGGLSEGSAGLPVLGVRERLIASDRDRLYDANINPIASFPSEGIVIFGQKTLQVTPSALDRINVRRLLIFLKKEISTIASRILFEQNVQATWDKFTGQVNPFLDGVQAGLGLTDYKVVLDSKTTTPDLVDRNVLYAKIFLKPARAIEFIALDFVITRSGASFDD